MVNVNAFRDELEKAMNEQWTADWKTWEIEGISIREESESKARLKWFHQLTEVEKADFLERQNIDTKEVENGTNN